MKNDIKIADNADYKNVRKLWDDTFREDSSAWRDWYFNNIYRPQNAYLMYNDKELVSMAHFNPYPMMLNGKRIMSAALAGVATQPDQRKKGLAAKLIKNGLIEMRKRGVSFSFLYPFSYSFYRKFGYEKCYDNYVMTAERVDSCEYSFEKIHSSEGTCGLYEKFAKDLNGYIVRENKYQQVKFLEHFADGNDAFIIKREDEPVGYLLAEESKDKTKIIELICGDIKMAAQSFSCYINKPIEYISAYSKYEKNAVIRPHCMGRVTDVTDVFNGIKAKKASVIVKITDDIIKENSGSFLFESDGKELVVTKKHAKADVDLTIGDLALLASGHEIMMNSDTKTVYDLLFDKKMPWIAEVC